MALYANTTGGSNARRGLNALYSLTGNNVAMATANTTASNNTAVGYQALYASTGASNTSVGWKSGDANTSGYENVFLGTAAGTANTTGIRNLYVGNNAGELATTGSNNTFVGANGTAGSCGGAMTTGSKNTILGGYTGNQGGLDIRTSSNNIVLSDGDGVPVITSKKSTLNNRLISMGDNVSYGASGYTSTIFTVNGDNADYNSAFRSQTSTASNCYGIYVHYTNAAPNNSGNGFIYCADNASQKFRVLSNGNVQNVNNSYGSLSDQTLKENITDSGSQWDDIKAVRVRKYSLIADELDAPNQIGVIAQELEAAGMNGLVHDVETEKGSGETNKTVNYSILYMKAVKALQEAMDRIETLEAKVTALENA